MANEEEPRTASQGGYANRAGRTLELAIVGLFEQNGFKVGSFSAWKKDPSGFGEDVLLTNAPYTSIYGHKAKTEFLALSKRRNLQLRIECKWQQSSGSVDEKFPYLYLNCLEGMQEKTIAIIVDGGGAKPEAVAWLKSAVNESRYRTNSTVEKEIRVLSLSEFLVWGNKLLR